MNNTLIVYHNPCLAYMPISNKSDLAFKAFKLCTPQYSLGYFHYLDQQDVEQFPEFMTLSPTLLKCIPHLTLPSISLLNS